MWAVFFIYQALYTQIYTTRKEVPELRGPALICLSALDKKLA